MRFLIGTDEAGYGPNLGPLVVGATLWQIPDHVCDLYQALGSVVCDANKRFDTNRGQKIAIGDSKSLFKSRGGLRGLEFSVLTMLGVAGCVPKSLHELFQQVAGHSETQLDSESTYQWKDIRIPVECDLDEIESRSIQIQKTMATANIACEQLTASVIFPTQFNKDLTQYGNKASLLTTITCRLARQLIDSIPDHHVGDILILCDRHGGRSRYAGLLQQEMTDSFVRVIHEDPQTSSYRWQESNRNIEARFMVKGEKYLPVGLASMVAKYLRELSMDAWNRYWREQLPQLQPTAGYPQDAKRFKSEIAGLQSRLNIDDLMIWRQK